MKGMRITLLILLMPWLLRRLERPAG